MARVLGWEVTPREGQSPLLKAGTHRTGNEIEGWLDWRLQEEESCLGASVPPTRRPRVLGSQSGSQDQLVASQAAHAPGLSPGL